MISSKKKSISTPSTEDSVASPNDYKNNFASTSSPSKAKSSPKKAAKVEDNGDSATHSNHDDEEEPVILKKGETAEYSRLAEFVQLIKDNIEQTPDLKKRKGNCNFDVLLTEEQRKEWPDFEAMSASFRTYYTKAVALPKVHIGFATARLLEFIKEDAFVTLHPDYPKGTVNAHSILCRKLGLGIGIGAQAIRLKDPNEELSMEAAKEAEADKVRYHNDLATFLRKHRSQLLPSHIAYVEKKLRNLNKEKRKLAGSDGCNSGTPKKSKSSKMKLTAFDYYKQSKKHKYLDMSPEDREAKMKRHFEKLDVETRLIFENLASNL